MKNPDPQEGVKRCSCSAHTELAPDLKLHSTVLQTVYWYINLTLASHIPIGVFFYVIQISLLK